MKYYFNLPQVGGLLVERTLIDLDIPILMICKDEFGNRYTALCIENDLNERYLILKSKNNDILDMLLRKITMRDLILKAVDSKVWYVSSEHANVDIGSSIEIDEENLPIHDSFYEIDDDSMYLYINNLVNELLNNQDCSNQSIYKIPTYELLTSRSSGKQSIYKIILNKVLKSEADSNQIMYFSKNIKQLLKYTNSHTFSESEYIKIIDDGVKLKLDSIVESGFTIENEDPLFTYSPKLKSGINRMETVADTTLPYIAAS